MAEQAVATPNGRLMAGAIGNFLLGGSAILLYTTGIGVAMAGGPPSQDAAAGVGMIGLIAVIMVIGGGICASLGWFGLGKLYGGTNGLAGFFSILFGLEPLIVLGLAMVFVSKAQHGDFADATVEGAKGTATIVVLVAMGIPALTGIFGGLGAMSAKAAIGKIAGIVLLIGGASLAALAVLAVTGTAVGEGLGTILLYAGFFGSAAGFILSGVTMLSERKTA